MEFLSIINFCTTIIQYLGLIITIGAMIHLILSIKDDNSESKQISCRNLGMGIMLLTTKAITTVMVSLLGIDEKGTDENLIEEIPTETPTTSDMPSLVQPDYSGIFIKALIIGGVILLIAVSGYMIITYLIPFIKQKIDDKEKAKLEEAKHETYLKTATLSELATDYLRQNKTQLEPLNTYYDPEMEALIEKYKVAPKKSTIVAKKIEQHNNINKLKQGSM